MGQVSAHLSTGLTGLDRALRGLIPGDNIVWQVDSIEEYTHFIQPYCRSVQDRGKQLIYFRFAEHEPLVEENPGVEIHHLDPHAGFESFVANMHRVIEQSGRGAWFLFDRLSDLAITWNSDNMLGNLFLLTCPYLYDVEAIAYFCLERHAHASEVITLIRETAQVFIDVYHNNERLYVHPIKVQQRHSPTMYMLHEHKQDDFIPVAESATTAEILSTAPCLPMESRRGRQGVWFGAFLRAEEILEAFKRGENRGEEAQQVLNQLLTMAITRDDRIIELVKKYFSIEDILAIGRRIIGTGLVGGKAVGMLLARSILNHADPEWAERLEVHDSFYVGSDVFYTFLVQNGLWWEWQKHKDLEHYLEQAEHARQRILVGHFPEHVQSEFQTMLDYFGQSPIIVRSSSLLEDNYGHSFAGKYDSVFLANQGSRERRLKDFISAVRTIYASTLSERALRYRAQRGMLTYDEQMALLIQRVSGAVQGDLFYPHIAGVGFSYNPYAWSKEIDPEAGMLRLVFGLGTRAVDRSDDDYARLVSLNAPERSPISDFDDMFHYTQRRVDILDLQANQLVTQDYDNVVKQSPSISLDLITTLHEPDNAQSQKISRDRWPKVIDFQTMFKTTDFVDTMRRMLAQLQEAYKCPVDMEFTANFLRDDSYKINLVQCRPLQIKVSGPISNPPEKIDPEDMVLKASGAIIGQSRLCAIDRIIYVVPAVYGELSLSDRYSVARLIGTLMHVTEENPPENIMLLGPGRWGTTTPWLGIPVAFGEINNVSVLCEIVAMHKNLVPDVSLGTHFFSELVEADILYFALFPDQAGNALNMSFLEKAPNRLRELVPEEAKWAEAVRVIDSPDPDTNKSIVLNANTLNQRVVCYSQAHSV